MTLSPGQLLRGLAVVVFLVVWAVLAHSGSAGEGSADLSVLLGVAQFIQSQVFQHIGQVFYFITGSEEDMAMGWGIGTQML